MEILMVAAVIGILPAAIAQSKGYSFGLWWIFGALLFIIALPVAILMPPNSAAMEQRQLNAGMKKCALCAELIKQEALICKHCGHACPSANQTGDTDYETRAKPSSTDETPSLSALFRG
jgi:hypothetical protein